MYRKTALLLLLTIALTYTVTVAQEAKPSEYGTNFLRFSPVSAVDIGVGFGVGYEKLFGKEKMIGLVLPVYLILQNNDGQYYSDGGQNYNTYVYFAPGIKIYPFGQRRVTYAVGPSLLFGYGGGEQSDFNWDPNGNPSPGGSYELSILRVGVFVNNYVNFQISPAFNLGLEGGLGIRYLDREKRSFERGGHSITANGFDITGLFSLTLGYRF